MASNPLDPDFTPDMYDYDLDEGFDFDNADLGGQMIGGLPGDIDHHEKRKNPEGDSEDGGDAKRQETQEGEKGSRKPGRKPLTNEPTTKRKAQNRAAQRAFRERKEKHLKDLETQVSDLTKASEADKHENGLLRAQVDKLQVELREYRKRLSLNSSGVTRSPPLSAMQSQSTRNQMNFNFDFPKFGSLPSAQVLQSASITPPLSNNSPTSASFGNQAGQYSRQGSEGHSMSPLTGANTTRSPSQTLNMTPPVDPVTNFALYSTNDNLHGFADTLPQMGKSNNDALNDLFSPSIFKSIQQNQSQNGSYFNSLTNNNSTDPQNNTTAAAFDTGNGGDSTAGIPDHRVFRFNSNSAASNSASPSASSSSQWNNNTANSSCGTSPEPAVDSPAINAKPTSTTAPQDPATAQYDFTQSTALNSNNNDLSLTPFDSNSFNVPQLDSFDPVLFGDYRDTTNNILGAGDFTGGFFDDGLGMSGFDLGSPSNLFGILSNTPSTANHTAAATTPSRALLEEIDKARDGGDDDFGLPVTNTSVSPRVLQEERNPKTGKLVSCTSIWNQLQSNPDFQDGKFDLDGLCSELRTKARCSESGLMVDSDHVDAALKKVMQEGGPSSGTKKLYFEQGSWDGMLNKMNAAKQT